MRYSAAIDGMFATPGRRQADVAPARLTPLQAHFLAQFAHMQMVRQIAAGRDNADLQRLVERVSFARYRDCIEQGVAEGARAIMDHVHSGAWARE